MNDNVNDLIKATGYENEFEINYIETSFMKELEGYDEDFAIYLTDFCEWYEWGLVKYSNLRYNILDLQTNEFVGYFGNESIDTGSLRNCIEMVFYRSVDYFINEEENEDIKYIGKKVEEIIKYGKKYNLYNKNHINYLLKWLEKEKKLLTKQN